MILLLVLKWTQIISGTKFKKNIMKQEVFVRFANEGIYYNKISVDPKNIKDPVIFPTEVFCKIDGETVAIKREEWDRIHSTTEQTTDLNT